MRSHAPQAVEQAHKCVKAAAGLRSAHGVAEQVKHHARQHASKRRVAALDAKRIERERSGDASCRRARRADDVVAQERRPVDRRPVRSIATQLRARSRRVAVQSDEGVEQLERLGTRFGVQRRRRRAQRRPQASAETGVQRRVEHTRVRRQRPRRRAIGCAAADHANANRLEHRHVAAGALRNSHNQPAAQAQTGRQQRRERGALRPTDANRLGELDDGAGSRSDGHRRQVMRLRRNIGRDVVNTGAGSASAAAAARACATAAATAARRCVAAASHGDGHSVRHHLLLGHLRDVLRRRRGRRG
mmetsp:Transcript_3904/g.14489  ORF Transcript_3904/g.14489 Transcript_3904/m.14489 type:complete len:303 (-) Transcript_3904:2286-3194(-)